MKKDKKKHSSIFKPSSVWKWINSLGIAAGLVALFVTLVTYLVRLGDGIERLDKAMEEVKLELKKTSNLLDADLSWRYLYKNDPAWKNLAPRYNSNTRTLEFIDTTSATQHHVRKP